MGFVKAAAISIFLLGYIGSMACSSPGQVSTVPRATSCYQTDTSGAVASSEPNENSLDEKICELLPELSRGDLTLKKMYQTVAGSMNYPEEYPPILENESSLKVYTEIFLLMQDWGADVKKGYTEDYVQQLTLDEDKIPPGVKADIKSYEFAVDFIESELNKKYWEDSIPEEELSDFIGKFLSIYTPTRYTEEEVTDSRLTQLSNRLISEMKEKFPIKPKINGDNL